MGIHVAHIIVDGLVRSEVHRDGARTPDDAMDPDAIASARIDSFASLRNAWTHELDFRPWVESF